MLDLFHIPITDQSVQYLGQIFGNVGIALQGSGSALLGTMFKVFNTSLLVLGTIIVGWGTVMGVMKTAAEGEFMGKQGSMWTPLRMVLGIAALVPTNTGYCAIQTVVMWLVMQGIGMADSFWNVAVYYFEAGGSIYTPVPGSGALQDAAGSLPKTLSTIMQDLVCQAAVVKANDPTGNVRATTAAPTPTQTCVPAFPSKCPASSTTTAYYNFGRVVPHDPQAACECGQLVLCGDGSPNAAGALIAQQAAVQTILTALEPAVNMFANQVINDTSCWINTPQAGPESPTNRPCTETNSCNYAGRYMSFIYPSCVSMNAKLDQTIQAISNAAGANFIGAAINMMYGYANNYVVQQEALRRAGMGPAASTLPTIPSFGLQPTSTSSAQSTGWIFAGAFYYLIALHQNPIANNYNNFIQGIVAIQPNFTCQSPTNCPTDIANQGLVAFPQNAVTDVQKLVNALLSQAQTAIGENNFTLTSGEGIPMPGGLDFVIAGPAAQIANAFIKLVTNPGGDPIVAIHTFGHRCLIVASAVFVLFMVFSAIAGIMGTVVVIAGFTVNPMENVAKVVEYVLMPLVYFFMGYLIVVGSLLGIYLPMIPFTFFAIAAVGWFILVIEAMFAAPLVAIGILMGGQQNEILGRAEPSIMIMLNIILRPSLMVGGMFSAMLVAYVSIEFVNVGFSIALKNLNSGGIGVVEVFCWLIFYIYLVITVLNKCYSLIYVLPDKVLSWVGGHGAGGSEEQAAGEVKAGVSGGGSIAKDEGAAGVKAGVHRGGAKGFGVNTEGGSKGEKLSSADRIRSSRERGEE